MALDPLTAIAGPESAFGTNTVNPNSSARGTFQDLSGTWGDASCAIGYCGTYATANDAPQSVQFAANAWLYNQRGFQPWTVGDPQLSSDIAAAGGDSAYAARGTLSTNPADYAAVDQPGGLSTYFASQGATVTSYAGSISSSPFTDTSGSSGSSPTAAAPSSETTTLDHFFSYMYSQLVSSTQATVDHQIQQMQMMVGTYEKPLFTIALAIIAMKVATGRADMGRLVTFMINLAVIISAVSVGSFWYSSLIVKPAMNIPAWTQKFFAQATLTYGNSPVTLLDWTMDVEYAHSSAVWHAAPLLSKPLLAVELPIVRAVTFFGEGSVFLVIVGITILLLVAVILGPVCIPFGAFEPTRVIAWGWAFVTIGLVVSYIAVNIGVVLWFGVIINLVQSMRVTGTASRDSVSLWAVALAVCLIGHFLRYIPHIIQRIFGGVAVGMEHAAHHMGAGVVRDTISNTAAVGIRIASRI